MSGQVVAYPLDVLLRGKLGRHLGDGGSNIDTIGGEDSLLDQITSHSGYLSVAEPAPQQGDEWNEVLSGHACRIPRAQPVDNPGGDATADVGLSFGWFIR